MKGVHRSVKLLFGILLLHLAVSPRVFSQENMMAEGNSQISLTYGAYHTGFYLLKNNLAVIEGNSYFAANEILDYDIKYTNPIGLCYEYAISDYTTIGAALNFFSFQLHEYRVNPVDSYDVHTRGMNMNIMLRGVRYFTQKTKSSFYIFLDAGLQFRVMSFDGSPYQKEIAYIHQSRLTGSRSLFPFVLNGGIGTKFLVARNIGICLEAGYMSCIARGGIFYNMKHKDRKDYDKYGW